MIELCRNTLKDEIQVKYCKSLLSIYFIRFPFHSVSELAARRHGKQTYPRPRVIPTPAEVARLLVQFLCGGIAGLPP